MPLLVVTGLPCVGKSRVAQAVRRHLEAGGDAVVLVGDEDDPAFDRRVYADSDGERSHRGWLRSRVQASLRRDVTVVCDSLNYIKGFRYELHCVARSVRTTCALLHVLADEATAGALNARRPPAERYSHPVLAELRARYEPPNAAARWDRPLVVARVSLAAHGGDGDDVRVECDFDELRRCLDETPPLRSTTSTQNAPQTPADYVQRLEAAAASVCQSLADRQRGAVPGDRIVLEAGVALTYRRPWTAGELARVRRQFVAYHRGRPAASEPAELRRLFALALRTAMQGEDGDDDDGD